MEVKCPAQTADIHYCPTPSSPPDEPGFERPADAFFLLKTNDRWSMQTVEPKVELKRFDGGIVLTLKDAKISGYRQVEGLKREILPMLENEQAQRIVLDFANVRFFASPFFGLIIRIRQKTGRLELCNLDPNVREVLEVTNLTKVFPVCKDPLGHNA
jgi:anti-anti-sigma factor